MFTLLRCGIRFATIFVYLVNFEICKLDQRGFYQYIFDNTIKRGLCRFMYSIVFNVEYRFSYPIINSGSLAGTGRNPFRSREAGNQH